MTNVMKPEPLAAIKERATTFVSKCVEAGKKSVDVYVSLLWLVRFPCSLTSAYQEPQVLLHCYAVDCVTHFMFSPGGLKSLNVEKDFEIMEELTYHQSLQSK